jgi:DMSO/TMAO reductase YedYZ heme-binding membrane subunit
MFQINRETVLMCICGMLQRTESELLRLTRISVGLVTFFYMSVHLIVMGRLYSKILQNLIFTSVKNVYKLSMLIFLARIQE